MSEKFLKSLRNLSAKDFDNLKALMYLKPYYWETVDIGSLLVTSISDRFAILNKDNKNVQKFTEKAVKVIMLSQEEARRLGHNWVGTEQILLGVIGEGTGIGAETCKLMGITLKDARVEVEKITGMGSGFVAVEIPFTPRAKRVLELAWDEAKQLGHNYIDTEHLFIGLIREGEGVAARVLENLGVDLDKALAHTILKIAEKAAAKEPRTTDFQAHPEVLPTLQDVPQLLQDIKDILLELKQDLKKGKDEGDRII